VYVDSGGAPVFQDCVFRRNVVDAGSCAGQSDGRGGAVFVASSSATFSGCHFEDNSANQGGALFIIRGSVTLDRCTFVGNTATQSVVEIGGSGGSLCASVDASIVAEHCQFVGNVAEGGLSGYGFGGAVAMRGGSDLGIFNSCVFTGNSAGRATAGDNLSSGGGLYVSEATEVRLVNCVLDSNVSHGTGAGAGAAAFLQGTAVTVTGCTLTRNGGTDAALLSFSSAGTVENSIMYANASPAIDGPAVVRFSNVEGGNVGDGNIDADPLFIDPANGDYRLGAGSPCIDAADNTAAPLGFAQDLAGEPRFRDDLATADTGVGVARVVDMGAYEFQPGPFCVADFNDDGATNTLDFIDFLNAWNAGEPTADIVPDAMLDTRDVLAFLSLWNSGC
jgi:hypothetical protein